MTATLKETLSPAEVAQLIRRVARPYMKHDSWCLNAARVTRDVLSKRNIKCWPVHCTVAHINKQYIDVAERHGFVFADEKAEVRYNEELQEAGAWMCYCDVGNEDPGGFPGHVMIWVPEWSVYLDPSGHQFDRPQKDILIGAEAWPANPPPAKTVVEREDGGVTLIAPHAGKAFKNASGYRNPMPEIVAEVLREWPT